MTATASQIATFKRLARKVHAMWQDKMYGASDTDQEVRFNESVRKIEASLYKIECEMTPEQVAAVEEWAYSHSLYGILGTC